MSDDEAAKVEELEEKDQGGDVEKRKRKRKRKTKSKEEEEEVVGSGVAKKQAKDRTGQNTKKGTEAKGGREDAGPQDGIYANNRTVYIEGVPFAKTDEDVRAFFASCGEIVSLRLPKWQDTGRLRGYGHVEFASTEGADKAKQLDGTYMGNRFIAVTDSETPRAMRQSTTGGGTATKKQPPGCKTIFVKNLPYECTEGDVREALMVCGPIETIRLAVWSHTNKLKGFGYVDFKTEESAGIAVKKNGQLKVSGRPVVIDFEVGKAKASFKGGSSR